MLLIVDIVERLAIPAVITPRTSQEKGVGGFVNPLSSSFAVRTWFPNDTTGSDEADKAVHVRAVLTQIEDI